MYKLVCLANNARPGAPLAPILGQIQVKVQDFIVEFNKQSADYIDELPLSCRIKKLNLPTKFVLTVMPPSWWQLIWGGCLSETAGQLRRLSVEEFYDCFFFRYRRLPIPVEVRSILGSLKGCRITISIVTN